MNNEHNDRIAHELTIEFMKRNDWFHCKENEVSEIAIHYNKIKTEILNNLK